MSLPPPQTADGGVTTRPATREDKDFVLETSRRLAAFPPPVGRTRQELVAGEVRTLEAFFDGLAPGSALLVAVGSTGERLGFAYLETLQDYFTREQHGHLGMIAVTEPAEGRGIGRALLDATEAWARSRGFRKLTLTAFEGNRHAREVFERRHYHVETLRYVTFLHGPDSKSGAQGSSGVIPAARSGME